MVGIASSGSFLSVDDTTRLKEMIPPEHNFGVLKEDLDTLSDWANQWSMSFNASKTEHMIIGDKADSTLIIKMFI